MKHSIVQAFWYYDQVTGEFNYRIKGPGLALDALDDFQVINLHIYHPLFPNLALNADLLILHLLPDEEIWQLIRLRKQAGKATIFEIADNFLSIGPWMSANDAHRNTVIRGRFLNYAAHCDGVQFSTAPLIDVFGHVNPNHAVFTNHIAHFSKATPPAGTFVFGWGGSLGHRADLAGVAAEIIAFCKRHEDAVFSYMGVPSIYEDLFSEIPEAQRRYTASGPLEDWYTFLDSLHVGLAPLADSEFNRTRSDIKFLEYAAHHVVPVLSDIEVYRREAHDGETALMFTTPQELGEILEDLYNDPEKTGRLADQAHEYAMTQRDISQHVEERVAFYQRYLPSTPQSQVMPELPDCVGLMAHVRKATHLFDEARYAEAMETLDSVLAMHGTYQAAHLLRARIMVRLGQFEEMVGAYANFQFDPVHRNLFLEVIADAVREMENEAWRDVVKEIDDPLKRLELVPLMDREAHLREVLKHHPYEYDSLQELSKRLLETETTSKEGLELQRRAEFINPI